MNIFYRIEDMIRDTIIRMWIPLTARGHHYHYQSGISVCQKVCIVCKIHQKSHIAYTQFIKKSLLKSQVPIPMFLRIRVE